MVFVAVLRRTAGGCGLKVPRRTSADLFMRDAHLKCVSTYLKPFPPHLTQFICFGSSSLVQRRRLSALPAAAAGAAPAVDAWAERAAARDLSAAELQVQLDLQAQQQSEEEGKAAAATTAVEEEVPLYGGGAAPHVAPAAPPPAKKVGLHALRRMYESGEPLSVLTAYDYPSARLADGAGADVLLVGDSLGMVVLGQDDTTEVTVSQMVHHCQAAARGTRRALLVADLPFGAYLTPEAAASNGVRLVKEGRADAVKLEGGVRAAEQVRAMVDAGLAVMGHVGFTPQSVAQLGGYRVQGRSAAEARSLLEDAEALQEAGCFAVVLEMVPAPVAALITSRLRVPTIGIGAGGGTSGQVQVFHDVLGLYDKMSPRFSHQFARLEGPMRAALRRYCAAVKRRSFPARRHSFDMSDAETRLLEDEFGPPPAPPAPPPPPAPPARVSRSPNGHTSPAPLARPHEPQRGGLRLVRSIDEWRQLQRSGELAAARVGLVPTMGALHAGHLRLVEMAREASDVVVASIFVNPKQFNKADDLARYPRTLEEDAAKLASAGVDLLFAPSAGEMYPEEEGSPQPFVDVSGFGLLPEARHRPGHFRGVATVVAKLLNILQPSTVYFGQKDGLQCVLARRLVAGLNFDTEVVVGDTVREPDGLAMSSRNVHLSQEEREAAPLVYTALLKLTEAHKAGERSPAALRACAAAVIASEPRMALEYVSLAAADDGRELEKLGGAGAVMASIAVQLGETRLIDNVLLP